MAGKGSVSGHQNIGHPGERVLLLRNRLGLKQTELADLAGLHLDTVSNIELGYRSPTMPTLHALATALGTTIAYLLTPIE